MGKVILRKNGVETQYINGEDFTTLIPQTGVYYVGVDVDGTYKLLNPIGNISDFSGGGGVIPTTYSDLVNQITGSTLEVGSFYFISDFQTCYDQPDFDYNNNPITVGNYKQGPVEPILVLAISANTISEDAYQPLYPNDKIKYDWSWNMTEVTGGQAFGRITERIDEFNNRTDYDHRNILFKRYRLFTHREQLRINGTVEILSGGTVNGTDTLFSTLTVGDVIYTDNTSPSYFEVVSITDDVTMTVSGDTINQNGPGSVIYRTIEETNDLNSYFSHKRTNVKSYDYLEYTTFGDALLNSYVKNTYVGNLANNYQNAGNGFLLANNVFLEGEYESNKFGDYCYNNTWGTDNQNNVWGDFCYGNVSTNDIDGNTIGHYFNNNLINVNLVDNNIGNSFESNKLLAENNDSFRNNNIGNGFINNIIYSNFYENTINVGFNDNVIGDYSNLTNFEFWRNQIGNNFNSNTIKQNFQNNKVRSNYQNNIINGEFQGNTVLNGFNNNIVGDGFNVNEIGNAFNNNKVNDLFLYNKTQYYFNSNIVGNESRNNDFGSNFQGNKPLNYLFFGWQDLTNVSTRTYDNLLDAVGGGGLGARIIGKEFVMRVISTSQYFKFKFYQWTQSGNGGGFQYERTEIDSSGNIIGPTVVFTKRNYVDETDIIIPGVLEIARGNNNGIYNIITEVSWNGGVSPADTEWNSIYTEPNNGRNFSYNKIGYNFYNNLINNDFGFGGNFAQGNVIGDNFRDNTIDSYFYNNVVGNFFQSNTIGLEFENNNIKNFFIRNTILDNFQGNVIGDYFGNNASGLGTPVQNFIGNDFKYNKIGNFFGNDSNYPSVGTGSNGDGGNVINDGCQYNVFGDNVIFNLLDLNFSNNTIGNDFWFNAFGVGSKHNTLGNLFVGNTGSGGFGFVMGDNFLSNKIGNYAGFNLINADFANNQIGDYFGNAGVSSSIQAQFNNNFIGNYFGNDGTSLAGGNTIDKGFAGNYMLSQFYDNTVGVGFVSNNVKTPISSIDFDISRGNILTYTLTGSNGGTDGTYTNLSTTSNYGGVGATLDIVVSGGVVTTVTLNNMGQYYIASEVLTVAGSQIGGVDGVDDVFVTVNTVVSPSVYEYYTTEIFSRQDGLQRLSYYDVSDSLLVKDIYL